MEPELIIDEDGNLCRQITVDLLRVDYLDQLDELFDLLFASLDGFDGEEE